MGGLVDYFKERRFLREDENKVVFEQNNWENYLKTLRKMINQHLCRYSFYCYDVNIPKLILDLERLLKDLHGRSKLEAEEKLRREFIDIVLKAKHSDSSSRVALALLHAGFKVNDPEESFTDMLEYLTNVLERKEENINVDLEVGAGDKAYRTLRSILEDIIARAENGDLEPLRHALNGNKDGLFRALGGHPAYTLRISEKSWRRFFESIKMAVERGVSSHQYVPQHFARKLYRFKSLIE